MGKGATSESGKKKTNIQNRKFHYNFYDTVTALRAKLFVAKLKINQSLQGVGAGVEIENFYIVPERSPFSHAFLWIGISMNFMNIQA